MTKDDLSDEQRERQKSLIRVLRANTPFKVALLNDPEVFDLLQSEFADPTATEHAQHWRDEAGRLERKRAQVSARNSESAKKPRLVERAMPKDKKSVLAVVRLVLSDPVYDSATSRSRNDEIRRRLRAARIAVPKPNTLHDWIGEVHVRAIAEVLRKCTTHGGRPDPKTLERWILEALRS